MKIYQGNTRDTDGEHVVTVGDDKSLPRELSPRLELANHSPTGFAWGFNGSGPAQLALAICADVLGNDEQALAVYQAFKERVLAPMRDENDNPVKYWVLEEGRVRTIIESILVEQAQQLGADRGWTCRFTAEQVAQAQALSPELKPPLEVEHNARGNGHDEKSYT